MYKVKDNYFFKIAIFFAVLIVIGLVFRHYYYPDILNSKQLNFKTYLGDNQAYHPKVLYFEEGWNGYKYWVAFTPYKNADDTIENPTINASNDMINWEVPTGLTNPLDIPDEVDSIHYNSDTHLVYNDDTNQLEVFWRYVDDENNKVTIFKSVSSDGVKWSNKEAFLYSSDRKKLDYVSPAINYENGVYKIWYVNKKQVWYIEKSGEKITSPRMLNIPYKDNMFTWHIDLIDQDNKYEMIMVAYYKTNERSTMSVYYSSSNDNIDWSTPIEIIRPSTISQKFDSYGLYRSSILKNNNVYYIFYSGHDRDYNVGIGLMCGKNIDDLKDCSY